MGRIENIDVFKNTERLCKTNKTLKEIMRETSYLQKVVLEKDELNVNKNIYDTPAKVIVSKKRSLEAAKAYKDNITCVLNFASASNPGGGVLKGATAQEEAICRCSTLYFHLSENDMWQKFYKPHREESNPLHNDDCIYTPDVMVVQSDTETPEILEEKDWYSVNIITCAAPNLRANPSNAYNSGDGNTRPNISDKALLELHKKRLKRILDIAIDNKNEIIILGAFGCGAFKNPPEIVAKAMKEITEEYKYAFKVIEYAVYCSSRDDRNYKCFERVFKN